MNCVLIEKDFARLQTVAQYNAKVEPCRYWCYLIIGVIFGVWAIYFQVHIWGAGALDNYGI